ncbi:hypothetical protein LBMAG27_19640 [Bacteroidota bacterium]|nr:hypothetical protein LBMAG27_19640 [Bacteroidota bacterium]
MNCFIAQAQTSSRPNILVILTDDMSYKMLDIYSNDTFIHTPNIDRIKNEGAELKYYSTNSLCIPGRTSLLTGNYGHKTGAMNNGNYPSQSLPTIPKILHSNGYYTAMLGKWMIGSSDPKPEFDYWLWTPNATSYYNDSAKYFNSVVNVTVHMTDFLTDSALQLIGRIDTPFFMMLNYNAPHYPFIPQLQYENLYDSSVFSLPPNWPSFTENFPSFLYGGSNTIYNQQAFQSQLKEYYELMYGVEKATGRILDSLQSNGLLENTMVIFTTDNGYLFGEHHLRGKYMPYNECMRMPLFIRYPSWFQPGTTIDSSIALNIDIAPTILEAIGIPDTFNMDGTSIHSNLTNQFKRTEFLYEQTPEAIDSTSPVRTLRDNYFQYNRYYCDDTTEELFDMITDPYQQINLVHHYLYQDTLALYRLKLDSIRLALIDTVQLISNNCYLVNPTYFFELPVITATHNNDSCGLNNGSVNVTVINGVPPYFFNWNTGATSEDLINISSGAYHLTVTDLNGSSAVLNVSINNLSGPLLSESHTNATFNNADGSIDLSSTGYFQPFQYMWSNGESTQDLHDILAGVYSVTVTNNIGCVSILSTIISSIEILDPDTNSYESTGILLSNLFFENQNSSKEIIVYPNPATNQISISSSIIKGESIVEWYNCYGIILGKTKIFFGDKSKNKIDLNNLSAGIYFIRVENGYNNFIKTFSVVK